MKLLHAVTMRELKIGDKVKTFRDVEVELIGMHPPQHPHQSGRVTVRMDGDEREFYPSVINAVFIGEERS